MNDLCCIYTLQFMYIIYGSTYCVLLHCLLYIVQALHGFIMMVSCDGTILYISGSVFTHTGLFQVHPPPLLATIYFMYVSNGCVCVCV